MSQKCLLTEHACVVRMCRGRGKSPRPTHIHTSTHRHRYTHHVVPMSRNHPKEPFFSLCERAIGGGAGADRAGCKEDGRGKMQAGPREVESTGPSAEERCAHGVMHRSVHVGSARARTLRSAGALGRLEPSRPPGAQRQSPRPRERARLPGRPRQPTRILREGFALGQHTCQPAEP